MRRPLADKRPIGPFAQLGDDVSKFDLVEVDRLDASEETIYEVTGLIMEGDLPQAIGLVAHTNTLTINGDTSFAIIEEDAVTNPGSVEITAEGSKRIGIEDKSPDLVNIIIPE